MAAILKHIILNENYCIVIKILLNYVLTGQIIHIPALIQMMTCHQTGNKLWSEWMVV